jgi:hypothetical protein
VYPRAAAAKCIQIDSGFQSGYYPKNVKISVIWNEAAKNVI